jgi:hypothetical protein
MVNMLLNRKTPGKIANIVLDATINETHEYKNEVTMYPIEYGGFISDHIRSQPEQITINGFITNTPVPNSLFDLSAYSTAFTNSTAGKLLKSTSKTRVISVFEELLYIAGYQYPIVNNISTSKNEKILIDIVTGLRVYTDMALISLSIPRDSNTGESLHFTATFIKVTRVKSEMVLIPNVTNKNDIKSQASNKVNSGSKVTTDVKPGSRTSIAATLYDRAAKGLDSLLK